MALYTACGACCQVVGENHPVPKDHPGLDVAPPNALARTLDLQRARGSEPLALEVQARAGRDDVVVAVVVEHPRAGVVGAGGDDESERSKAMVADLCEFTLGLESQPLDLASDVDAREEIELRSQRPVIGRGLCRVAGLQQKGQGGAQMTVVDPSGYRGGTVVIQDSGDDA
jgi:hypothetical protein